MVPNFNGFISGQFDCQKVPLQIYLEIPKDLSRVCVSPADEAM